MPDGTFFWVGTVINVMKIRIQDFGPIRDFTFDLDKDLHLLYGKNGTGKSYAVYCVYVIIKALFIDDEGYTLTQESIDKKPAWLKKLTDKTIKNIDAKRVADISSEVENILKIAFADSIKRIEDIVLNTYGLLSNLNSQFSIGQFQLSIHSKDFFISLSNNGDHVIVSEFNLKDRVMLTRNDNGYLVCSYKNDTLMDSFPDSKLPMWFICTRVLLSVMFDPNLLTSDLHFLPASRSGLYQGLNSFGPIIAELSKQRHLIKKKIELPTLSESVSNYFLALSSINKQSENKELENVVKCIENDILKGKVIYNVDNQRIIFSPRDTHLNLELSTSSSMVAELSPLVTYLKYVIKDWNDKQRRNAGIIDEVKNSCDILFIEEPEAHLHPEAQVKLMEILAELPKHNIKVVMTSHSDYMFNKLTNLILEKKVNHDKVATYHMVMTDKGSVVEDDMPVTDEGIEDSNFLEIAEQLYEERMRLSSEMTE